MGHFHPFSSSHTVNVITSMGRYYTYWPGTTNTDPTILDILG